MVEIEKLISFKKELHKSLFSADSKHMIKADRVTNSQ